MKALEIDSVRCHHYLCKSYFNTPQFKRPGATYSLILAQFLVELCLDVFTAHPGLSFSKLEIAITLGDLRSGSSIVLPGV